MIDEVAVIVSAYVVCIFSSTWLHTLHDIVCLNMLQVTGNMETYTAFLTPTEPKLFSALSYTQSQSEP